jgi:hypothetical protein
MYVDTFAHSRLIHSAFSSFTYAVTYKWFTSGRHSLFALSIACILLPILIQWVSVGRSVKRRVFTLFQIKLVTGAWASFWGGKITQGREVVVLWCSFMRFTAIRLIKLL